MLRDLRKDLSTVREQYGYLTGRVLSPNTQSRVVIGLYQRQDGELSISNLRTVEVAERFFLLVPDASYTLFAFADDNNDFVYQPGEAATRIDDPMISNVTALGTADELNYEELPELAIELSKDKVLDQKLDLSLGALRKSSAKFDNFLGVVEWDDDRFSDANVRRGMWEPGAFQERIGYGLYSRDVFDPSRKSIVLVHGINGSPRDFRLLADQLPAEYQVLLFHYASGFPLEHSSLAFTNFIKELLRRYEIQQLDIIAHSMGGLVTQGMLYQLPSALRSRLRNFISIATPFAGHAAAELGIKWAPTVAPVWWSMAPHSHYLKTIASLDLSSGPNHHLVFSFSHEAGGASKGNDGVVSVTSQLTPSAQRRATGVYGIADNHSGVVSNACTLALLSTILTDGSQRVLYPDC